eukprot:184711-Prorocentrum_lima.AAC.1
MCACNSAKAKLRRGSVIDQVLMCPVEKGSAKALGKIIREDGRTVAPKKRGELVWFEKSNQTSITQGLRGGRPSKGKGPCRCHC